MMASPNRTVNHWLHQSRCSSPARHRESRAVLLASSTLELHHQKAALCAPPGTPSGRTAISWPRALHPGGCPLARGILIWPVVISYAYAGFMAISFPLLACLVLVWQGSPTDRGECFEGRAGRPVPAMTLSDVPHKPRPRAFAPPGHGLAIFPRSLSLACLAVLRPRVPLPRYFVAAARQSAPGPWCRGGVG